MEEPQGGYSVCVEEIPGANSQAGALEEAKENLMEAVMLVGETNKQLSQKKLQKGTKNLCEPLRFDD